MIRGWFFAAMLLVPAPADAAIRALFVGVNQYRYSSAHNPRAQFADLKGTVNDVAHIKAALRDAYALDLDTPTTGCVSRNAISTTLTDDCASRAAVMAELAARIAQSAPGDTLLFYYAGHGATVRDDVMFDQPSGYDTTILTTDAREPGADASAEILDRDINGVIEGANARGVNVVTIFDSCYSETGTRDLAEGQARDAPLLVIKGLAQQQHPLPVATTGVAKGYRVHLAAAREDEKARETNAPGGTSGVFTTQLAATLRDMRGATFDDMLVETRRKVEEAGQGSQSPRGNGALTARLGGADSRVILIDGSFRDGAVTLAAGRLSGVTRGSRYALFEGSTTALGNAAPRASGNVTSVTSAAATLTLDPSAAALPARIVARESKHAFGTRALLVRNMADRSYRASVSAAITAGQVATEAEPAQLVVKPVGGTLHLATVGGQDLADLGLPDDPRFAGILAQETGKVSRVNDLIGLRTAPDQAGVTFCIDNDLDYDLKSCPPLAVGQRRKLAIGQPVRLVVHNLIGSRYVYVLGIDEKFGVSLIVPDGNTNPPLDVTRPLANPSPIIPNSIGAYRFVTIASDLPIDASALEQSATGARGIASCASANALQRTLCAAMQGARDPDAPRVGDWTAIVTDVDVVAKGAR